MVVFILSFTENSEDKYYNYGDDYDIQKWFFHTNGGFLAKLTGALLGLFEYYQLTIATIFTLFFCSLPFILCYINRKDR